VPWLFGLRRYAAIIVSNRGPATLIPARASIIMSYFRLCRSADALIQKQGTKNTENLFRFELDLPGHKRPSMAKGDIACPVRFAAERDADKTVPKRVSACCLVSKATASDTDAAMSRSLPSDMTVSRCLTAAPAAHQPQG